MLLSAATAGAHPFYVTICQIDHNPESASLEITLKFFTDDLERALTETMKADDRLVPGSRHDDADPKVDAYVRSKLSLLVNGEPAELRYVGKEVEIDTTYVYVEALDVPELSTLSIRSTILLELFEDHDTIVNVRAGGREKSLLLRKDDETGSVSFER